MSGRRGEMAEGESVAIGVHDCSREEEVRIASVLRFRWQAADEDAGTRSHEFTAPNQTLNPEVTEPEREGLAPRERIRQVYGFHAERLSLGQGSASATIGMPVDSGTPRTDLVHNPASAFQPEVMPSSGPY